jgi:tRNA(Ile)-lysidine synthase TilS/MesJ
MYIVFGCNRGGESTTMLVRVLNREGGNSAACSQPIRQYEDGAESYSNLVATV